MAHHCEYTEKLIKREKCIIRIATAIYKDKKETVYYEELESGKSYSRYIFYSYLSGYLVVFPGEQINYTREIMEECDFEPSDRLNICTTMEQTMEERCNIILSVYPDLKYLIDKLKKYCGVIPNAGLFDVIRMYRQHPQLEYLIPYNQLNLALNKSFYKLSKNKLKQVLEFVKNNNQYENMTLANIYSCIKYKLSYDQVELFNQCKKKYDIYKYLAKQQKISPNVSYFYYCDYLRMVETTNHNVKDDYWRFPKNLVESHDKLMVEINNIEKAKVEKKERAFKNTVSYLSNKNIMLGGYMFYIPQEVYDVVNQANVLHQCLITCDYVSKVIDKKSVLIFIKQNNEPVGTIEIDYDKNIKQAYGNEADRGNCLLSKSIMDYAHQFINTLTLKKQLITPTTF